MRKVFIQFTNLFTQRSARLEKEVSTFIHVIESVDHQPSHLSSFAHSFVCDVMNEVIEIDWLPFWCMVWWFLFGFLGSFWKDVCTSTRMTV